MASIGKRPVAWWTIVALALVLVTAGMGLAAPAGRADGSTPPAALASPEAFAGWQFLQALTLDASDAFLDAQLAQLLEAYRSGEPFSLEEADLLERYASGATLARLETETLLSRALYIRYVTCTDLTREQEVLLEQYADRVAQRPAGIADEKAFLESRGRGADFVPLFAPPANDLCEGAEAIPGDGPFPYLTAVTADITEATETAGDPTPACQASHSRSIWYTFTPTASGNYTFTLCQSAPTGSTVADTVLALFTSSGGCAGAWTQVACDDDSCATLALQSITSADLTAGTTYYAVVWKYATSAPVAGATAVQMQVVLNVPPANDTCDGAVPLTLGIPYDSAANSIAADDYELTGSTCFTGLGQAATAAAGRDVVYRFTAPSDGDYSFTVQFYSGGSNAVLYLSSACPSAPPMQVLSCDSTAGPVLAASNRNTLSSNAAETLLCVPLATGQTVYLFADDVGGLGLQNVHRVLVTPCVLETEDNGSPATANALACGISGAISPAGEADFFSLGAPAAGSRVFAMADGASGSSADFDLRVTTAVDTLEYDDMNCDAPFGGYAPTCLGTPLTGADAYLRMSHYSASTVSEPYRLYTVVQPPGGGLGGTSATAEVEPNDTPATASAAPVTFFSGALGSSADLDFFAFPAQAGDLFFLGLDTDPLRDGTPFNGSLGLYGPSGQLLLLVNDSGSTSNTTPGTGSLTSTTPNSPGEAIVYAIPAAGTYYARVAFSGGTAGDYLLSIARNCSRCPTFAFSPPDLPAGLPGVAYSQTLTVTGGTAPYAFALDSGTLPDGLSLAADGTLSGTPTASGTATVVVAATDAQGCSSLQTYVLEICGTLSIAPATLPNGNLGVTYGETLAGAGGLGPYTFGVSGGILPDGLSLSGEGVLSGTPTTLGTSAFDVTVVDRYGCTATQPFSVRICDAWTFDPASLPDGDAGAPYAQAVAVAAGGAPPYTYALTAGALPPGLALVSAPGAAWGTTGSLFIDRYAHTATLLGDGRVLVAGGEQAGTPVSLSEYYDPPGGFFAPGPPMVGGRARHAATLLLDGSVLVTGGGLEPITGPSLSSAELYEPLAGSWGLVIPMLFARRYHTATRLLDGRVLVVGGLNNGAPLNSVEIYDPLAHTFAPTNPLMIPRWAHTATLLPDGRVLVAGGYDGSASIPFAEVYDPVLGSWAIPPPMITPRRFHTATPLLDGRVLLAGGLGFGDLDSCELFDPGPNVFMPTGSLTTPRSTHSATRLPDGRVLVAGGGAYIGSCELYDPTSGLWTPAASLNAARNRHTETLLADGRVLVAGGDTGVPFPVPAELYAEPGLVVITGTPTAAGLYGFTLTATDSAGCTASHAYTLGICSPILVAPAGLPDGTVGASYSQTFSAAGAIPPYTFSVSLGTLPPGLALDPDGTLSGTPTAAGTYTFTVAAHDSHGCPEGTQEVAVRICPALTFAPPSLAPAKVSAAYSQTIAAGGGVPPYTYAVVAGALPDGLSLDATGLLSGTPTTVGISTFTVAATDSSPFAAPPPAPSGCAATQAYTLQVFPFFCDEISIEVPALGSDTPEWPSTHGQQTGRLTRDGAGSTCAGKACPGVYATTGLRTFDAYRLPNESCSDACVTVTVETSCADANMVFAVAYLGSFNPADLCANYLGDSGGSPLPGAPAAFSFTVPAHSDALLVLHEVTAGGTCPTGYSLTVAGLPCSGADLGLSSVDLTSDTCRLGGHGGGDGGVDAGEEVALSLTAANLGLGTASGVTATLTTADPLVTILQGSTAYPDLAPCASSPNSGPDFVVYISGSAACGSEVALTAHFVSTEGSWSRDFTLPVTPDSQTLLLEEAFETWPLTDWTVVNNGGACEWDSALTVWGRVNATGGTGDCADADSNGCGAGSTMDATLISPVLDLSAPSLTQVTLQYKTYFYSYYCSTSATGDVDVTTDGGSTWTNLLRYTGPVGPTTGTLDLSAFLGSATVQVGFHYISPCQDILWEVDDISVTASDTAFCSTQTCCPTLTVTPESLPGGAAYEAYSQTVSASGGDAPYQYTIASGTLPAGLALDPATGVLAGTPTEGGAFDFVVRAQDAYGCAGSRSYSAAFTCTSVPPLVTGDSAGCVTPGVVLSTGLFGAYQWTLDGVDIPGANAQTYTATASGTYAVRATDCYSSTSTSADFPLTVHLNPAPTVSGAASGCAVPGVPLATEAFSTYQWSLDGVPLPGATAQSHTAVASGEYTVSVVDAEGCAGTSAPWSVTVYENPTPTIVGPPVACMTAALSTQAFSAYQWYRNGFLLAGATGQNYGAVVPGSYAVRVTNDNGCQTTSPPFVVGADPAPIITGPSVGCASVTLSTGTYASYQWHQDGAPVPGATAQTYEAVSGGSYTVSVSTDLGCTGTSMPHSVTLFQAPTVTGPHSNTCPATQVVLTATPGYASYQWRLNGAPVPGATGLSYAVSVTGLYSVLATDTNGCTGPSADHIVFVDFCASSEVSPVGASFPARLVKSAASPTGYYLYFQRLDSVDGFNIYEGDPDTWYSHASAPGNVCNAAVEDLGTGEMRAPITPSAGDHYYLVTAHGGGAEGPSGFSSQGAQIDPAQSTCAP